MNESEILAYQREKMAASGTSSAELDRIFGTGAWAYETRVASQEAGDPYPFVPVEAIGSPSLVGYSAPEPELLGPPPRALAPGPAEGVVTMITNGRAVLPGAGPPAVMLTTVSDGGGALPDTSDISIQGLISILRGGSALFLGFIRMLISRVGWTAIAAVLGTALAAKVLAMLNDGTSDSTDVLAVGAAGYGVRIVKRWRANDTNFWMDSAGWLYAERRNGVIKRWKPKKPIVMVRGRTTLAGAVKAQRYLDHLWRTVAKRTKALKLA